MLNRTNHSPEAKTVTRRIVVAETRLAAATEVEPVVDVVTAAPREQNLNQSRA